MVFLDPVTGPQCPRTFFFSFLQWRNYVAECRSTPHHRSQTSLPHYVGAPSAALAPSSAPSGVQARLFGASGIVWSLVTGQMPTYLADDIRLVSEGNRRSLRSSIDNMCAVPRTQYAQQLQRQKLWSCRSANLEQSATRSANT